MNKLVSKKFAVAASTVLIATAAAFFVGTRTGSALANSANANAAAAVKAHSAAGGKSILYLPTGTYLPSQPVIFYIQGTATNFVANNIVVDRDSPTSSNPRISNSASVNRYLPPTPHENTIVLPLLDLLY